jgi:hypothetical protein
MKIKLLIIFIITILPVLFLISYLKDDKDFCLDTAICKEGLEINTEHGRILVNKENCEKYNWIWDDENKMCDMNVK